MVELAKNPLWSAQMYRKKPVEVQVMRFDGWGTVDQIRRWATDVFYVPRGAGHSLRRENEHDRGNGHVLDHAPEFLVIKTLEGDHRADLGDWVIRGVEGEFYPCKPDIFAATYDPASES